MSQSVRHIAVRLYGLALNVDGSPKTDPVENNLIKPGCLRDAQAYASAAYDEDACIGLTGAKQHGSREEMLGSAKRCQCLRKGRRCEKGLAKGRRNCQSKSFIKLITGSAVTSVTGDCD